MNEALRAIRDQEEGMTLVELIVSTAILGIVMVVMLSVLVSIQSAAVREDKRSQTIDQARLAIQTMDRQVRSGNLLYNPNAESPAYYTVRIYTQSNGTSRCVLWQINTSQQLQTRSWLVNDSEHATAWQTAATGVVNRAVSSPVNAFTLDSSGRTITVTFLVNSDLTHFPTQTEYVKASITGRNTSFGFPADVCEDLPS